MTETNGQHSDTTLQGGGSHRPDDTGAAFGQIVVYFEGRIARTLTLNVPVVTIGRTPGNVLPLPHASVSRGHAELRVVSPDTVILTDLGSSNGTFIGDSRLAPQQPVQLPSGTVFRIGPFMLRYEAAALANAAPQTPAEERPAPRASVTAQAATPLATYSPAPVARQKFPVPLPRESVSNYLDFLPLIFQDGDFLGRFLLIFQSIWEPLEYRQDHLPMYLDPRTAPDPFLLWLADWLGVVVNQIPEEGRLRTLLGEAVELYRWRGTQYGLTRMIEICTGLTPLIAESDADPAVLHVRVAVPPQSKVDREVIERLVIANKPAHTGYLLEVFG